LISYSQSDLVVLQNERLFFERSPNKLAYVSIPAQHPFGPFSVQKSVQSYAIFLKYATFFDKNALFSHFFAFLFGQFKKKQYLCSRF